MFDKIGKSLGVGGGDVFDGFLGGIGGLYRNKEARKAAGRQMAFQERMSNTQYQRTMADMRKAGLNPILAAKADRNKQSGQAPNPPPITRSIFDSIRGMFSENKMPDKAKSILKELQEIQQFQNDINKSRKKKNSNKQLRILIQPDKYKRN